MGSKTKRIRKLKRQVKDLRARIDGTGLALVSPLAPKGGFPEIAPVRGVRLATAAGGVRHANRTDLMLAELSPGTSIAGVFTRSSTRSASVLDCQEKIGGDSVAGAAIVVNSGNANAFTGSDGQRAVSAITGLVADTLDVPESRVFSCSTGVIGERLPHDRITSRLAELKAGLAVGGFEGAARAIMTTDTFPKGAFREIPLAGKRVRIAGIAKGSGMVAPDMATTLAFVFTDAHVRQSALQEMLSRRIGPTFNSITVDSDTSTSDTLLLAATGQCGADASADSEFEEALQDVMADLALQVVRDGEGATKLIGIRVTGARDDTDARRVAMAIGNSPLVKTAIAGGDPNWGRIVMAVGKSGAEADRDTLSIRLGDIHVAENGWVSPTYRDRDGVDYLKGEEIEIHVDLGIGQGVANVWSCDLTPGYISINASYRS